MTNVDLKTGSILSSKESPEEITALVFNKHSNCIAVGTKTGKIQIMSLPDFNVQTNYDIGSVAKRLVLSADGNILLKICESNKLFLLKDSTLLECLPEHKGEVLYGAISSDNKYIASIANDCSLHIYSFNKGRIDRCVEEKIDANIQEVAWSNTDLLIGGKEKLRIMKDGEWIINEIPEIDHGVPISNIVTITKNTLVTGSADGMIKVWRNKECIAMKKLDNTITEIKHNSNERQLIVQSKGTIGVINIPKEAFEVEQELMSVEPYKEINNVDLDFVVGALPQEAFQVAETQFTNNTRFLCWNRVGSISLTKQERYGALLFDFTNKTLHRNISLPDTRGAIIGCMAYSGAILASKAETFDINKYQEDDESKRYSTLQFVSFEATKGQYEWERRLLEYENAEVLAIGSRWIAVSSDFDNLRMFSLDGNLKRMFSMPMRVITMCGYENLLAIVYCLSAPIFGNQRLSVKVIDVLDDCNVLLEVPLPLSPMSTLKWIGFSEEGQLFTYDSKGVLRGLLTYWGNSWIPLYKINMWIINISEGEVLAVPLKSINDEPLIGDKNQIKVFSFKIPLLPIKNSFEEQYITNTIKVKQEIYRRDMWGHYKIARKKNDPTYWESFFIQPEEEIISSQGKIDKMLLDKVREASVAGNSHRAITCVGLMHLTGSVEIALRLTEEMGDSVAGRGIYLIYNERKKQDEDIARRKSILTFAHMTNSKIGEKKSLGNFSSQAQTTVLQDIKNKKKYGEIEEDEVFLDREEAEAIEQQEHIVGDVQFVTEGISEEIPKRFPDEEELPSTIRKPNPN